MGIYPCILCAIKSRCYRYSIMMMDETDIKCKNLFPIHSVFCIIIPSLGLTNFPNEKCLLSCIYFTRISI